MNVSVDGGTYSKVVKMNGGYKSTFLLIRNGGNPINLVTNLEQEDKRFAWSVNFLDH